VPKRTIKEVDLDELKDRVLYAQEFERMEAKPVAKYDPSEGMSEDQLRNFVRFLYGQLDSLKKMFAEVKDELKSANGVIRSQADGMQKLNLKIAELSAQLCESNRLIKDLTSQNAKLIGEQTILKSDYFGTSKSRKGQGVRKEVVGKNDGREDFDGTPSSLPQEEPEQDKKDDDSSNTDGDAALSSSDKQPEQVNHGSSRKGYKYNKQIVGEPIEHKFDRSSLPAGCKILRVMKPQIVRDLICRIEEHHFERLKVLFPDGVVRTLVCPVKPEEKEILERVVPGTHITTNLLSDMVFNRYQMCSPDYREAKNRWADMQWNTCRQNLGNWADKGAVYLSKLVPALKAKALEDGANVNVDETWCRYQTHFGHKKTYMWCLVNRKAHIVIFFYEDCTDDDGSKHQGGRRRSVLTDFLGDANIKSLQSDGYNVYMYLDDELVDIEHLCCLAHAQNKFKDALKCGCEQASHFIEKIGRLYTLEKLYQAQKYNSEQIKKARNGEETTEIVKSLQLKMLELLARPAEEMCDKMHRALNYLHTFWTQLFRYRDDGDYSIDNMAAERAIRPMTVQRKNSLFYCSTNGATRSAVYNTFIETCRSLGISFRQYFEKLIIEMNKGRTDYENLLPMTISLNNK
jgi:hypothetical protein